MLSAYLFMVICTGIALQQGSQCCAAHHREKAIQRFNAKESPVFIFLLSIRAAGRGLNLQSADTVVIYDPDPNPKNEEQVSKSSIRKISQQEFVHLN